MNTAMALRVAFGTDHGGLPLREVVLDELRAAGCQILDFGARELDAQDDYPDYAGVVADAVARGLADRGVLLCGSGVGMALAANRVGGVRACLCHDTFSAAQGVHDDDMNVLCLGARVIGPELARLVLRAFLQARFAGDQERYVRRVQKIERLTR